MSARKIRNSWWVDFRAQGIRYRVKSPADSRTGAQSYEAVLRQRLAKGESLVPAPAPPPPPTFREFSGGWLTTYVKTNNKPSEQRAKTTTLRAHLVPNFGTCGLAEITTQRVEEYKAEKLNAHLSPKTINNHLVVLRKCLATAQEWGFVSTLPRVRLLKVPPQRFDFLTEEECGRLLQATTEPRWHCMILLALRTGLRFGELLGLMWDDVDLQRRILTVRRSIVGGEIGTPKNNRARHIPLTQDVCDCLQGILRLTGFVFGRRDGSPIRYHDFPLRVLRRTCERAGIRRIGWHALRHTFASVLASKGVSLRAVQELLGHSDIRTTMRYAHLGPSTLRDAVDKLEEHDNQGLGQPVGNTAWMPKAANDKLTKINGSLDE